jgi:condensin complex subunit 2
MAQILKKKKPSTETKKKNKQTKQFSPHQRIIIINNNTLKTNRTKVNMGHRSTAKRNDEATITEPPGTPGSRAIKLSTNELLFNTALGTPTNRSASPKSGFSTKTTNERGTTTHSTMRMSKTPLKSPMEIVGILSPNNDRLERAQSMKKRAVVANFRKDLSKNCSNELDELGDLDQFLLEEEERAMDDDDDDDDEEDDDDDNNVVNDDVARVMKDKQKKKKMKKKRTNEAITTTATTNSKQPTTQQQEKQQEKPKPKLTQDMVMNLYANCIKLASENKINAKNTWSLALIDHISDIVKNEKDEDDNTNFQKASCTLDAGVKIYASRVDSFHSETFRMLGGISNVSGNNNGEEDEENMDEDDPRKGLGDGAAEEFDEDGNPIVKQKKQSSRASNVITLENPENHTMKVMEDVVHVDPLFKKTSSMFDEGGASGLLLNNLSVHKGCNICFDSEEVPDYTRGDDLEGGAGTLDLSQMAKEIANAFVLGQNRTRITPSIDAVHEMLADVTGIPYNKPGSGENNNNNGVNTTNTGNNVAANGKNDDFFGGASDQDAITFAEYDEDEEDNLPNNAGDDIMNNGGGVDDEDDWGLGNGAGFNDNDDENDWGRLDNDDEDDYENNLTANTGSLDWIANVAIGGKQAWAGPSHWHFKKTSTSASTSQVTRYDENGEPMNEPVVAEKKKKGERDLTYDFENLPELDDKLFDLAQDPNDLLLKSELTASDTLLPPDLGYEAQDLIKLFLKPQFVNTVMAPKRTAVRSEINFHENDNNNNLFIPNNDDFGGGDFNGNGGFDDDDNMIQRDADGNELVGAAGGWNDDGDNGLVDAPRKVEKIEVNYARTSKVVDIRALKQTLWKDLEEENETQEQKHSFNEILSMFPEDNPAGRLEDISVHMAFICALHLANEHGLVIKSVPEMNDLVISNVPTHVN